MCGACINDNQLLNIQSNNNQQSVNHSHMIKRAESRGTIYRDICLPISHFLENIP